MIRTLARSYREKCNFCARFTRATKTQITEQFMKWMRKTNGLLFGFLAATGVISHNPTQQLIPPEREHKEPRFLTKQEYQALLRACSHETRDAAIIELILQTGIRLSEVARLTIHDIELPLRINRDPVNTGSIFLPGKGRKERSLPLNYKVCRSLKAWLAIRPEIDESNQ